MYNWVSSTHNFLGGRCEHNCKYCFVKSLRFPIAKKRYSGKLRLLDSEFKKSLGKGKTIFICDCNDLFARNVPDNWIKKVLEFCKKYPDNTYLFQTKNPMRFKEFVFAKNSILGITLETNQPYKLSKAPPPILRYQAFKDFNWENKFVSIEPILEFDLSIMIHWIKEIKPKFVSIGADSKHYGLNEPLADKINALIKELEKFTIVKIKSNLKRLIKKEKKL